MTSATEPTATESTARRRRRAARIAVLATPAAILAVGGVVLALGASDESSARKSGERAANAADTAARAARQPAPGQQESPGAADPLLNPDWLEGDPAHRAKVDALMGKPAPPLKVDSWINSQALTWDDLKGKTVMLFFWSPTCHTCQQAMPQLNGAYRQIQANNLPIEFIGVCRSGQAQLYSDGVEHHGIAFPTALDRDNATWNAYHANGTPDFYVIDDAGVMRAADVKNAHALQATGTYMRQPETGG